MSYRIGDHTQRCSGHSRRGAVRPRSGTSCRSIARIPDRRSLPRTSPGPLSARRACAARTADAYRRRSSATRCSRRRTSRLGRRWSLGDRSRAPRGPAERRHSSRRRRAARVVIRPAPSEPREHCACRRTPSVGCPSVYRSPTRARQPAGYTWDRRRADNRRRGRRAATPTSRRASGRHSLGRAHCT